MIPSQDQIPYNGIESQKSSRRMGLLFQGLKTKFRITELKVEILDRLLEHVSKSQDQIPYNGIESSRSVTSFPLRFRKSQDQIPYNGIERKAPQNLFSARPHGLKTKFRITELKDLEQAKYYAERADQSQDQIPYNGIESRVLCEFQDTFFVSQDQIPYNGIESVIADTLFVFSQISLKTKFRITELKV